MPCSPSSGTRLLAEALHSIDGCQARGPQRSGRSSRPSFQLRWLCPLHTTCQGGKSVAQLSWTDHLFARRGGTSDDEIIVNDHRCLQNSRRQCQVKKRYRQSRANLRRPFQVAQIIFISILRKSGCVSFGSHGCHNYAGCAKRSRRGIARERRDLRRRYCYAVAYRNSCRLVWHSIRLSDNRNTKYYLRS